MRITNSAMIIVSYVFMTPVIQGILFPRFWYRYTYVPTCAPTYSPTYVPTYVPTYAPTYTPTCAPTYAPTYSPTHEPICAPTYAPTYVKRLQKTEKAVPGFEPEQDVDLRALSTVGTNF